MVVHLRKRFNVVIQSVEALCKSTVHLCRRVNGGLMLVLLNFSLHICTFLQLVSHLENHSSQSKFQANSNMDLNREENQDFSLIHKLVNRLRTVSKTVVLFRM